jgi:hypothetical protein
MHVDVTEIMAKARFHLRSSFSVERMARCPYHVIYFIRNFFEFSSAGASTA